MISKIAGHSDFHKIAKAKSSKNFLDKTAQKTKKVIETKNGSNTETAPQQTPYDSFIAQKALAEIKKAQLLKKK